MINSSFPSPAQTSGEPGRFRTPLPVRAAPILAALVVVTTACSTANDPQLTAQPAVTVTATETTTVTREANTTSTTTVGPTESTPTVAAAAEPVDRRVPSTTATTPDVNPQPAANASAGQRNATRSAEQYLSISGFSRSGLIEQLQYEGYTAGDAANAVDSLTVDWNQQAARSARQYLDISGFSRSGLIEQLQYEGYTPEQAGFGASAAGL